jgi:hypothetical protein
VFKMSGTWSSSISCTSVKIHPPVGFYTWSMDA